jgi:hypothetical protein
MHPVAEILLRVEQRNHIVHGDDLPGSSHRPEHHPAGTMRSVEDIDAEPSNGEGNRQLLPDLFGRMGNWDRAPVPRRERLEQRRRVTRIEKEDQVHRAHFDHGRDEVAQIGRDA